MKNYIAVTELLEKMCQRKNDNFFGSATHKIWNLLDTNVKKSTENNFIGFECTLHS